MQRTLEILRQWEIPLAILIAYYIVAALIVRFVYRRWYSRQRAASPRRYRLIFAIVLALVFTPSVISDFFLFMIPGPATLELLLLFPSVFVHPWPTLYVITIVCLLPLAAGFGISYFILWLCDRQRPNAAQIA